MLLTISNIFEKFQRSAASNNFFFFNSGFDFFKSFILINLIQNPKYIF